MQLSPESSVFIGTYIGTLKACMPFLIFYIKQTFLQILAVYTLNPFKSKFYSRILEIKNVVYSCLRNKKAITWIPSHPGIAGNEFADSLVKQSVMNRVDSLQCYDLQTAQKNVFAT